MAMARAGADILIPHMGLTTKGMVGAETAMTLEQSAAVVQRIGDAADEIGARGQDDVDTGDVLARRDGDITFEGVVVNDGAQGPLEVGVTVYVWKGLTDCGARC